VINDFILNFILVRVFFINGVKIVTTEVTSGKMTLLNSQSFMVCPDCGYAREAKTTESNLPFVMEKHWHKTPEGYKCQPNKEGGWGLEKFSLGCQFSTDITRIIINYPIKESAEKEYEFAYSILQSLILSSAGALSIDEKEIGGYLQYYFDGPGSHYAYILYDTTPGGAGHVKRINNEIILNDIFKKAYLKAKKCHCGGDEADSSCYSCLRTYRNQKHHDEIKRKYVIEYLEDAFGYKV